MLDQETRLYIALFTDADVGLDLAKQLRQRGYNAISALELGRYQLPDHAQLEYAISDGRAILTFNKRHFEPLYEEYWNAGKKHFGIIVSEHIALGELLRRTLKLLDNVSADEMENNFKDLGEFAER
jgi:hypothetical protein